jgi:hypothetical protein
MSFDPAVLQVMDADPSTTLVVDVASGGFFAGKASFSPSHQADNDTGQIEYSITLLGEPAGVSGSGVLFRITFQGKTGGQSAISFTSVALVTKSSATIPATIVNGSITVTGGAPPSVVYTPLLLKATVG